MYWSDNICSGIFISMNAFLKEIKSYGHLNHIMCILFILFFLFVAKKIELQLNIFGVIYWYVACLLMGHYSAQNVKPTKKWKYKKGKNRYFCCPTIRRRSKHPYLRYSNLFN